ncbi:MAG TPA: DUF2130 domain-containing protein [Candidatus Saccharimonadales bacterium]|nr:DUF2130 domain-containing protein [Candidatus Saccharimonadales bacterium]
MSTITCKNCGEEIEISAALQGQIEAQVLAAEHKKHEAELAKVKADAAEAAQKQLRGEKELLEKQNQDELDLAKKRLEAELESRQKKANLEQELFVKTLKEDAESAKETNRQLHEQLTELTKALREERKAKASVELEAEKKIAAEEAKIREEASKAADEKQRLNLAARDKTIADLQKALDDAQRKASQGSQQLQGEIMELDLEEALANSFRDDDIEPVAKGIKGGDIRHVVKSPRGTQCGVILWEIKRTKNWTDSWIPKLKEDLRSEKANVPIIVTEVMPKQIEEDMGVLHGVWVCKPRLAIVLATLLRKGLLDAGLQKALAENRGTKAEALYNFITSHEFVQQIESMVETYQEMTSQLAKEKVAFQKIWSQREAQAQRLLLSTANIIGSMQGHIGNASMPKIKGLELLESGDEI